jgi:hypothetical protein
MQFPKEIQRVVDHLVLIKETNFKRVKAELIKLYPVMEERLLNELAHNMSNLGVMSKLLMKAYKKQPHDLAIADMYVALAMGIAESYNTRAIEGENILKDLFSKIEEDDT